MTITIQFIIPGKPAAWQRARSNGKVRFDSPEQTRNKQTISQIGFDAMAGRPPLTGPLEVTVAAYWPWPKSKSEKKRKMFGAQYFTSRPDADNIGKLLGDALNSIVWADDAYIVNLTVKKRYSLTPQTVVRVETLMEDPENG
jgi:Holliday junction resolvase RusA-like endonuclease